MGRDITRMRYHNNKDEEVKKRKADLDAFKLDINKATDQIEKETRILEMWLERNEDENGVMKR